MHVSRKTQGDKSRVLDKFSQDELNWLMKHSYNLGVQYYGEWPRARSLRMLETCIVVCQPTKILGRRSDINSS